jgi:NADPH:quinone reductase-like Zn-dependent oxidoreductase
VLAAYATAPNPDDPLAALVVGERPEPVPPEGWTTVTVAAASLNHHDLWTLRGVGISADQFPMIVGCDAAGRDEEGAEVVVHSVIPGPDWAGDETLDPGRSLLSERHPGTFAERVVVPRHNVLPKPAELSAVEAACLPTAWLTAYRMLFVKSGLLPGQTVLVQGSTGGVATALIALGRAGGFRVWVTGRTEAKRDVALKFGAHAAFEPGARLPERVDAVMETVGQATWSHSVKALRPGGVVVVSGATSGAEPSADLRRVFFRELSVLGCTMGSRAELAALMSLLVATGVRPAIDTVLPLHRAADGFAKMAAGEMVGKIVFTVP